MHECGLNFGTNGCEWVRVDESRSEGIEMDKSG